jgi:hypothetical protein
MRPADGKLFFKEWLPDKPALDNPGLIAAGNSLPVNESYRCFLPLAGTATALPGRPNGGFVGRYQTSEYVFASASLGATSAGYSILYMQDGTGWTAKSATLAAAGAGAHWDFAQYEDLVIAVNNSNGMFALTAGATTNFTALATSGTAPAASYVGVIGQFVVAGGDPAVSSAQVRWSGIDNPRSWPTPNSTTAIAQQSGAELLDFADGPVTGITGGDQFGLVFQDKAITRFTYVGGGSVFQIDKFSDRIGCYYPNSIVAVGSTVYFWAQGGIYVTDGASIREIANGKVGKRVFRALDFSSTTTEPGRLYGAADIKQNIIYWAYRIGDGTPTRLLIYNYLENRFSEATQTTHLLFDGSVTVSQPYGFQSSYTLGTFTGAPGSSGFDTGEVEFNPGGYTFVQGVKPLVDATANAMTVTLLYRNDQHATPSATSNVTQNSRSGFADFRLEARYVRARVTITGTYNAAQGIEFQMIPTGAV